MSVKLIDADANAIACAANILREGGLVGMPTETVYGLAADASNAEAVARIYEVKGRPRFNPLIAHVSDLEMAQREVAFSSAALAAVEAFWPGPLTLVAPLSDKTHTVCALARAGLDTLAVRAPAHPIAHELITAFGGPLVAPSANPSGRLSPTTAQHVAQDLGDKLNLILDGGPCAQGLESTIVDFTGDKPALLRLGALSTEDIEAVTGPLLRPERDENAPKAPGQLIRHYAPNATLRLNAEAPEKGEAFLGFGPGTASLNLSPSADLREAAANLFAMLRALDQTHPRIAVAPVPNEGLGAAINERLARAAQKA